MNHGAWDKPIFQLEVSLLWKVKVKTTEGTIIIRCAFSLEEAMRGIPEKVARLVMIRDKRCA